jgi:hypothetical protein
MGPVEPRIWLALSVAALLASVVPYWYWLGTSAVLLNAVLVFASAALLIANYRGERRLAYEAMLPDEDQDETVDGAPSSTNGAGTSTEPSSSW